MAWLADRQVRLTGFAKFQSWLPFTVHVCINGREWLCRELSAAGIGFRRRDNCLVDVEDFPAAQKRVGHALNCDRVADFRH